MSRKKTRKSKSEIKNFETNPFDSLGELNSLPEGPDRSSSPAEESSKVIPPQRTSRRNRKNTSRGRLDITRETAHRGGKVVIVVSGFKGIGMPEKKELAKKIQQSCGVGGTVKDGRIEIRGDNRDEVKRILTEAGFNPVFAGG
jgi:translation initiation factor 1